jgi:hypothetical protein
MTDDIPEDDESFISLDDAERLFEAVDYWMTQKLERESRGFNKKADIPRTVDQLINGLKGDALGYTGKKFRDSVNAKQGPEKGQKRGATKAMGRSQGQLKPQQVQLAYNSIPKMGGFGRPKRRGL